MLVQTVCSSMTKLILVLLVLITGCTLQPATEADMYENPNYNGGINYAPEQWGQRALVRGGQLQEGQPFVILQNDGSPGIPHVRTAMLTVVASDTPAQANNILRWVIDSGAGGANSRLVIDALGTQQISLPSSKLTISLMATKLDLDDDFVLPDVDYAASAFIAVGNTSTPSAHYTTVSTVNALSGVNVLIPAGATGFRIGGNDPGASPSTSPFTAAMNYTVFTSGFQDVYFGDDLFAIHSSEGFIPLPGGARNLSITSANAGTTDVIITWQLDI